MTSTPNNIPAKSFPLAWRWTSETHDLLPDETLRLIQPLSRVEADLLAPEAVRRFAPRPVADYDLSIVAEWDEEVSVRNRLLALPVPADTPVIIYWSTGDAVRAPWHIFAAHWDAFCYPSSDDVTVWSEGQPWCLCYRHFELIQYATSAPAAA